MIDEKATYEKFGYYSTDLKPKSHKKVIVVCDGCGKVRILRKDDYHARCKACANKGERSPHFGKHPSEETRKKMSDTQKGESHPFFGKHHSEETRKKISDAKKGENHPNWQGGISYAPYCEKFNDELKEYIRDKFGRICFLCNKTEDQNGRKLSVHHVNYNKACGCDEDKTCQFVPLCIGCNVKANFNRDMWEEKIKDMLKKIIIGWDI